MNWYISEYYWNEGERAEPGLIALDADSGKMVGFGTWTYVRNLPQAGSELVIRIAYFGVDQGYQGSLTTDGEHTASVLYSTLEQDATKNPHSTPDMPLELLCHHKNERGLRFWERMGYVSLGQRGHYVWMRVPFID